MAKFKKKRQIVAVTAIILICMVNCHKEISCIDPNDSSRILKCIEITCKPGFEPQPCTQSIKGSVCLPCHPAYYSKAPTKRISLGNGNCRIITCSKMSVKY